MPSTIVRAVVTGKDEFSDVLLKVGRNTQQFAKNVTRGFTDVGTGAQAGLSKASNALTNLAGNMLGVNNKVGNFIEGLGSFFVGSPVLTAFAAGFVVITALLTKFGESAKKAQENYDKYMDSLRGSQTPLAIVGAQLDAQKEKLADIQRLRPWDAKGIEKQKAQIAELETSYANLNATLHTEAVKKYGDELAKHTPKVKTLRQEVEELIKAAEEFDRTGFLKSGLKPAEIKSKPGELPLKLGLPGGVTMPGTEGPGGDTSGGFSPGFIEGINNATAGMGQFGEAAQETQVILGELAGVTILSMTDALAGMFQELGKGSFSLAAFGKAALRGVALEAAGKGKFYIAEGLAKIAQSLFPPNPAGLASGAKEIAAGGGLLALSGTLGGGGAGRTATGYGGGSGFSPGQFERNQADATISRGTVTIRLDKGFINPHDPDFIDWLARAIEAGQGRRVLIRT